MERLDPLYAPLTGLNLIEASAGTGKTYTLTALYLRLVMEAAIPVNRILVVTYTNAATLAFQRGRAEEDDEFSLRMLDVLPDRELAIRRLNNAVRGFDEAAIFTIHGFCQRALGDSAFESGLAFETEVLADPSDLLREIVEDFWRREFYPASPMVAQYFLDKKYSPEKLLADIRPHLGKPYLQVVTPEGNADSAAHEQAFLSAYQQAQVIWNRQRAEIEALLLNSKALNGNIYRKNSIPGWLEEMDRYLTAEIPKIALFEQFEKFTVSKLEKSLKNNQSAPRHAFFAACETLKTACETLADYCRHQVPVKLLAYCDAELAARKRRQQLQSYDDLLLNLHEALTDPQRGAALVDTLRHRYAAALIDEFQDTDPIQYAIFRRIYAGAHHPVFLVGDPKQAIYSFRGADIFAYLAARHDATRDYTLDVNWRSDPRLLTALNAVFGAAKTRPFLFDAISFQPAIPAEKKRHEPLWIQGRNEPPLQLWWLEPDGDQPLGKGIASERAARATAAEIARLLNLGARGQAGIGDRPLAGGDIAVLVRNHRQGRMIREQLLRLRVPSVQHVDDSVFASAEAGQLEGVLAAVLEPGDEGQVRAALAGDLFGLSGEALYQLRDDEQAWARWLEIFQSYRQQWRDEGFIHFFRAWLNEQAVAVHKSKGLEYPVVFCPFLWDGRLKSDENPDLLLYHDPLNPGRAVLAVGATEDDPARRFARHEEMAENLRLFYVALTRAKQRCTLVWGKIKDADSAPAAWLLHRPPVVGPSQDALEVTQERFRTLETAVIRAELRTAFAAASETVAIAPLPRESGQIYQPPAVVEPELRARIFAGPVPESWRVGSFTGLTAGQAVEAPDHDLTVAVPVVETEPAAVIVRDVFAFPRGARAGTCLHALFERLDFTQRDRERLESLVSRTLTGHGLDAAEWTPTAVDWVERVLATPLDGSGLMLATVAPERRLNELEFTYPVGSLRPEALRRVLERHGYAVGPFRERIENLEFSPLRGYILPGGLQVQLAWAGTRSLSAGAVGRSDGPRILPVAIPDLHGGAAPLFAAAGA
ncbi:MAG: exodeoxyribonuclease subunit beta [Proteobacteria bacterium]|nr:exodeoxyribonuclease subunit beta [Pseudomonadota bacterium]